MLLPPSSCITILVGMKGTDATKLGVSIAALAMLLHHVLDQLLILFIVIVGNSIFLSTSKKCIHT